MENSLDIKTGRLGWYKSGYLLPASFFIAVICLFVAIYLSLDEHPLRSGIFYILALLSSFLGLLISMRFGKLDSNRSLQLFICYLPFAALWLVAFFSPLTSYDSLLFGKLPIYVLLSFVCLVLPIVLLGYQVMKSHIIGKTFRAIKYHWAIVVVLLIYVLLSIETLSSWAVCNSWEYLHNLQKALPWNFSTEIIEPFRLCNHQSYAATLWYMVGGYITPQDPAGMRIINILLMASSIACFYAIVLQIVPEQKGKTIISAVLSCLYAFNPMVLGMVFEVNLDIIQIAFVLWLITAFLYNKNALFVFSVFHVVLSKETGVVVLAGFGIGWLLAVLVKTLRAKDKLLFKQTITQRGTSICGLFLGIALPALLYLLTPKWATNSALVDPVINVFELNIPNMFTVIKELYILNFAWVSVLIILAALVLIILSRPKALKRCKDMQHQGLGKQVNSSSGLDDIRKGYIKWDLEKVLPLVGFYVSFLLFILGYFTHPSPRYIGLHIPCFTILLVFSLLLVARYRIKAILSVASALTIILLVQNFLTIDPVTLATFKKIDIGKTEIITPRTFVQVGNRIETDSNIVSSAELTSIAYYNRQHSYFGTTFETFLADIGYNSKTMILVDPTYGISYTYLQFFGKFDSSDGIYYYDPKTGDVYQGGGPERLNLKVVPQDSPVKLSDYVGFDRVYYISLPYKEGFSRNIPIQNIRILDSGTVEYRLWEFNYYRIK